MIQNQITSSATSNLLSSAEQLTKFFGIAASAMLILSTAYDFSFLYALGLSFEEVPTTLSDHVRSAIVWAPKLSVYVAIFATYEMFVRLMEKGLSEEELIQRSRNPKFTRTFRRSPQTFLTILLFGFTVIHALLTASDYIYYLAFIVIWMALSPRIVFHPRLGTKFSMMGRRFFMFAPVVVIYVALTGYLNGEKMLTNTIPKWTVELKGEHGTEQHQPVGLRRFSTISILATRDRRLFLFPTENILSAHIIRDPKIDLPRVCQWFGIFCEPKKGASS